MAVARIEALLPYPAETVWRVVTDCTRCDWRSDLDRIETHGDGSFTEYTKSGYATLQDTMADIICDALAALGVAVFGYLSLRRQQNVYLRDLRRALASC